MAAGLRVSFLNKFVNSFDLEGYDEVYIQGPAGEIVVKPRRDYADWECVCLRDHLRKMRERLMG